MRNVGASFGAFALLVVASIGSNAQEFNARRLDLVAGAPEVVLVLDGCGPGFIRNRFGRCQPRRFLGGYGYRRFGYGYRPYGFRRYGYY